MSKLHRLMTRHAQTVREPRPKPKHRVIEDRTSSLVLPPARDRWDVVMLSPAANDGTLGRIDDAGFDVWRPRTVVLLSAATLGKAVFVNRPLWPRYAFVGRRDATGSLADVWSIGKPLTVGSVSGALVAAIAAREEAGEFDCRTLPQVGPSFAEKAAVETLDGLMAGIVLKSDEMRTVVLFRLMERDHVVTMETRKLRERT